MSRGFYGEKTQAASCCYRDHHAGNLSAEYRCRAPPTSVTFVARLPRYRRYWLPFRCQGRSIQIDRKSTRLNSSHITISYAVFCLKKKKKKKKNKIHKINKKIIK